MHKNMGSADRRLRAIVVAPVLAVVGVLVGPASWPALVLYALAAIMLATSTAGSCPLYMPFGLSTRQRKDRTTPAAAGAATR